ncbi:hypothetical protein LTR78_003109 [Recurvomyces mirabilis]|uniref:Uncharacterized protein n=1 Tax=Recurvomyces mirabilis TaxID=574656 RepID=A0AAE0WRV9_9PEZI|nr:hypothetical protein LTR78_003109 [Recurvomyces mirabilis]KAK5157069.1 hypothetical protein LTS14_004587 [Recurvomyces mirabilis]
MVVQQHGQMKTRSSLSSYRLERLYFPCCDRPQDRREAVFRYCSNSYLVGKKDAYRGKRRPCKEFKRPSEKCCARMLRARTVEVNILRKRVKSASSWLRGLLAPVDCLRGIRRYKVNVLERRRQMAEYQLNAGCENCSRLRAEWCEGRAGGLGQEDVEEKEVTEAEDNGVQVPRAEGLVRIGMGERHHAYWICPCDSCEVARNREREIREAVDDDLEIV